MRILHVLAHSVPVSSGYALRTLAMLQHQRALGWETAHLTSTKHPGGVGPEEDVEGLCFHRTLRSGNLLERLPVLNQVVRLTELVTPLKPLEAMARGRLVLASDVGGHRELIRHGETGVLFPAGDPEALAAAVSEVVEHPERTVPVTWAARQYVERERTWAASVARYESVYRGLLTGAAPGRELEPADDLPNRCASRLAAEPGSQGMVRMLAGIGYHRTRVGLSLHRWASRARALGRLPSASTRELRAWLSARGRPWSTARPGARACAFSEQSRTIGAPWLRRRQGLSPQGNTCSRGGSARAR